MKEDGKPYRLCDYCEEESFRFCDATLDDVTMKDGFVFKCNAFCERRLNNNEEQRILD